MESNPLWDIGQKYGKDGVKEAMVEVIQIDNNTWRIEDGFVRFFLLAGEKKAALVDSGISNSKVKELAISLTDLPLMLINTHGDGDHISGTGDFTEIYMSKEDYQGCDLCGRFPNTALVELHDRDIIDLGGRTLEIIAIPGHTKGSVAILDVEKRFLFAGDTVQSGHIFMFGPHRIPDKFEESLQKLANEKNRYDKIIASHDEPILEANYVERVLEAWCEVQSGKVNYSDADLHGMIVKSYDTKYCGFYL